MEVEAVALVAVAVAPFFLDVSPPALGASPDVHLLLLKIKKIELQLSLFIEQIFYLQTDYYLLKENYSLATSNKIK